MARLPRLPLRETLVDLAEGEFATRAAAARILWSF